MASYLIMTRRGEGQGEPSFHFIRDGFSFVALIMPVLWMLYHRIWTGAALLIAVDLLAVVALGYWQQTTVGTLVMIALSLLIALESGEIRMRHLMAHGWLLDGVVTADGIEEAEEIYFARIEGQPVPSTTVAGTLPPQPGIPISGSSQGQTGQGPVLGLFDYGKGR